MSQYFIRFLMRHNTFKKKEPYFSSQKGKRNTSQREVKSNFRLIMGRNCIAEVLRASAQRIVEVYTAERAADGDLYSQLVQAKVPIVRVSKDELTQMVNSESHQLFVAAIKETNQPTIKDFVDSAFEKEHSVVLLLDSIYDPHNLGAIIRAGECFGVDLVVFSKNRGADITPVATKTSAGATELVPLVKVSNLVETLKAFQKGGYCGVAAEAKEHAHSLNQFKFPKKMVLILGSEGKGIQPLLSKLSNFHVSIPMLGCIDSLNVSQAAAVLLCSYQRSLSGSL